MPSITITGRAMTPVPVGEVVTRSPGVAYFGFLTALARVPRHKYNDPACLLFCNGRVALSPCCGGYGSWKCVGGMVCADDDNDLRCGMDACGVD